MSFTVSLSELVTADLFFLVNISSPKLQSAAINSLWTHVVLQEIRPETYLF